LSFLKFYFTETFHIDFTNTKTFHTVIFFGQHSIMAVAVKADSYALNKKTVVKKIRISVKDV